MVTKHNPDYSKNRDADVVKKGSGRAMPNQQWEKNMNLLPQGSNKPADVFNPRCAYERPTTHVKVNECDH